MTISSHATKQYLARVACVPEAKEKTITKAIATMETQIAKGKEIELSAKEATIRLINNQGVPAKYIWNNGVLYVIIDDTAVTCYPFPRDRIARFVKH